MLLLTEVLLALTSWCGVMHTDHIFPILGPFICRIFFLDFKMIRSLCFATAVALLASPTGLAFKFKDDGEVDEAATFFGEDSDSTLAAEPAAPREERKIETKVTQENVEAKLKGDAEPTVAAAASAEGEKAEGRFFDIKGKLCALGLSSDVSFQKVLNGL